MTFMDARVSGWNTAIEVGLPGIDRQHREMFELAATFRGQGDDIRMMKTLAMLCDYAKTHLREEEDLLVRIGYPDLEEHRRHHAEFRRMLRELLVDARQLTLDAIADRVERLINGWFYQHVLHVDALYVPMVKAHEAYRRRLLAGHPTGKTDEPPDTA
jgi:hemerythrin